MVEITLIALMTLIALDIYIYFYLKNFKLYHMSILVYINRFLRVVRVIRAIRDINRSMHSGTEGSVGSQWLSYDRADSSGNTPAHSHNTHTHTHY